MSKHGSFFVRGALGFLLILFAFLTGCRSAPDVSDYFLPSEPFEPGSPFFLVHPTSVDHAAGDAISQLTVRVRERDGAQVSFQWFRASSFTNVGGTAIPGATGDTFTPDGPGYFYAVATGTDPASGRTLSRASHPARVRVGEAAATPSATLAITANQRQYIRGFGGMGNAFWIRDEHGNTRPEMYMKMRDIQKMFDPEGPLAFNIFRIHVFPAPIEDVLTGVYAPFMQPSNSYLLDFVRQVGDFGGYVVAAPWTAPFAHWKHNNSLQGSNAGWTIANATSNLRREHYRDYAEFLRDWAQEMADRGAPIHAISIQNEPTYDPDYYAMAWTAEQQREFMAEYGHIITGANGGQGVPGRGGGRDGRVRLMGGSPHNNVHWNNATLNDPRAREHLEIVAYHTYGDWGTRSALAMDGTPRRETWMMEKNVNSGADNAAIDFTWDMIWILMNEIHHVIAHNESSVYTWWYLKRWYSMIGEGAFGTVNGEILPRGYGMGHFSRFLSDTVRVEASLTGHPAAIAGVGHLAIGSPQPAPGLPVGSPSGPGSPSGGGVRVLAGTRTSGPETWQEMELKAHEDMVSVVLFDSRTSPGLRGRSADIRVELPPGFTATSAYGIISSQNQRHSPVLVVLDGQGDSAVVNLPSNSMISLRFRGEWGR